MADQITATPQSTSPRVPEGEYHAVCVDIVDMGEMLNDKFATLQHKCALVFQLEDPRNPAKRLEFAERFTVSIHEKARLRQFLEQWRGRPYKVNEVMDGAPLHKLEGVNAIVVVVHNQVGEKTFANIHLIRPLPKEKKAIKAYNYARDAYWEKFTVEAEKQRHERELARQEREAEDPAFGSSLDGDIADDDLPF